MKNEDIYDGITDIRDDIIDQTAKHAFQKARPRRRLWFSAVAAVLVLALVGGTVLRLGGGTNTLPVASASATPTLPAASASATPGNSSPLVTLAYAISEAEYPEMAPFPDEAAFFDETGGWDREGLERFSEAYQAWQTDLQTQLDQPEGYADGLDSFFSTSMQEFLSGAEDENRVYSPLNVYMALAMLAELTDGNSRQQILDLLGAGSIEDLRVQATAVWNANYCDDGATTSVLASSLWLNQNVNFVQETMDTLAKTYYASSYQGTMGSDEFNQMLRDWLNEQTGGLLEEQAAGIELDASTILALATTVYFCAKWGNEFSEGKTVQDVFHAPSGDVTCDFMCQSANNSYYWGDHFSAVCQAFGTGGGMWFILPDEGVSVDELLNDEQAMKFLLSNGNSENSKSLKVNLMVPKFDVSSDLNLISGLQELGVTDVFDAGLSDFTPMTRDTDHIFVSQARHAARVVIDEEGCTATAYTVMAMESVADPLDDEVDFVLNRPFLFVITSEAGQPLFTGVVNQPV